MGTPFLMGVLPSLADVESPRLRNYIFWPGSALLAAGAAVVYHWNPETAGFFPVCPIYALTGYYCPGCGMTRALHQLAHGHVAAAFSYNPLLVVSMPLIVYWVVSQTFLVLSGRTLPRIHVPDKLLWVALAGVVVFGVVRNIPYYPFTLLVPR